MPKTKHPAKPQGFSLLVTPPPHHFHAMNTTGTGTGTGTPPLLANGQEIAHATNSPATDTDESAPMAGNRGVEGALEPPPATTPAPLSSFASRLMRKLGWKEGEGLGAASQGIVEPIAPSVNEGRFGLGLPSLPSAKHSIDWSKPIPHEQNQVVWLERTTADMGDRFSLSAEQDMIVAPNGPVDYDTFTTSELVARLFAAKSAFDNTPKHVFLDARTRSNPYESIGKAVFMNRAALKMANLDQIFNVVSVPARDERDQQGDRESDAEDEDEHEASGEASSDTVTHRRFVFSNPAESETGTAHDASDHVERRSLAELLGQQTPRERQLACDICAGPGGFSEYMLWRKPGQIRVFGFTLRGENDFTPEQFHPQCTRQDFLANYGADDTGNILLSNNIRHFASFVREHAGSSGVHLCTGDGGFAVGGDENFQEEHLKQLVLCQFLTGLCVLRRGGTFICKVFDLFTPFSAGLVFIMSSLFRRICLIKPFTSRPANSERYIVCEDMLCDTPSRVVDYLFAVNEKLHELGSWQTEGNPDVTEIVAPERFDAAFVDYLRTSNESLARTQIEALELLLKYVEDRTLPSADQTTLREKCLRLWRVPLVDRNQRRRATSRGRDQPRASRYETSASKREALQHQPHGQSFQALHLQKSLQPTPPATRAAVPGLLPTPPSDQSSGLLSLPPGDSRRPRHSYNQHSSSHSQPGYQRDRNPRRDEHPSASVSRDRRRREDGDNGSQKRSRYDE